MKRIFVRIVLLISILFIVLGTPILCYFNCGNIAVSILYLIVFINILLLIVNSIRIRYFLMRNKKALIYADIRNSKLIKQYYGKEKTRKIINSIFKIIESDIGRNGYVYNISGDHFIILINYYNKNELVSLVKRINEKVRVLLDDSQLVLYLSFGIRICDNQGYESNENKAALGCNYAKTRTLEIYSFYEEEGIEEELKEKRTLDHLVNALKNNKFEVYFQPKYNYKLKKIVGSEALVRLIDNKKVVPAKDFIDVAEKYGFTVLLDKYVLKEVCKKINELKKENIDFNSISVNISRNSLCDNKTLDYYHNILKMNGIKKNEIEFEVTERDPSGSNSLLNDTIHELSKKYNVSLDDFGVGNSSIEMLNEENIKTIKIDRKFIIDETDNGRKILNNIIKLTKDLNFEIIAEGVETKSQYEYLKSKDCDVIQGYYYSKPLAFDDYKKLLIGGK